MYKRLAGCSVLLLVMQWVSAQTGIVDTSIHPNSLPEIVLYPSLTRTEFSFLPEINGTNLYAGKKNALVQLNRSMANFSMNQMRQILAKVPGVHIWESDPSGAQIGIATRGLSPNRSWDLNTRQNGHDIAADPYGYPEAYYHPPMPAVKRIEFLRGQSALAYGPQYGGMINYVLKSGEDITGKWDVEGMQTVGSNGLFHAYVGAGGHFKNGHHFHFYNHRQGDGWRTNSAFKQRTGHSSFQIKPNAHWSIKADIVWSDLLSQQPGGLPDSMIRTSARNSVRARNWMQIRWLMPTLTATYQKGGITGETRLTFLSGNRNSVGFLSSINVLDTVDALTGQYSNRKVQQDRYRNLSLESKWMIQTNRKGLRSILVGVRYFQGRTGRLADGTGTTGRDADFSVIAPFQKDQQFQSSNLALFTEWVIPINARWILLPGVRVEHLQSDYSGEVRTTPADPTVPQPTTQKPRTFLVAGIGTEYHFSESSELYAGFSQAYRPVLFTQLIQQPGLELVDNNLRDARGFNMDIGVRGQYNNRFTYDLSIFSMNYNDRIGTIRVGAGADAYRLITNIGSSFSRGFESLIEYRHPSPYVSKKKVNWLLFGSFAFVRSWYSRSVKDQQVAGKQVEHVPEQIIRGGAQVAWKGLCTQIQVSYTSSCFADARNTEQPSSDGQFGQIPAYTVLDWTAEQRLFSKCSIKVGINNLMDVRYFTRRASSYPGPGAMPADGRTFFMTIMRSF